MNPIDPFSTNAPQSIEPLVEDAPANLEPPANPAVVSQEQFLKMQQDLIETKENSNKIIGELNSQVQQSNLMMQNGMANFVPQGVSEQIIPAITQEQVSEAMNSGDPNAVNLMQQFVQQGNNSEITGLREELKTLRDQGHASLSKMASSFGTQNLQYYSKYKDEIDALVANSAPALRTDPATYEQAHNFIVGQHIGEILAENKEATLNTGDEQMNEPGSATISQRGSNSGRQVNAGKVDLSHQNVFSQDAMRQLQSRGVTPEQHALNTGFKDYNEFALYKLNAEGRLNNEPTHA